MTFAFQIVMKLGIFIIYMDPDLSYSQFLPLTNKAKYLKNVHSHQWDLLSQTFILTSLVTLPVRMKYRHFRLDVIQRNA